VACAVDFPSWNQIWCKNVDQRPNYGPETKFKIASAAILNLHPVTIFGIANLLLLISTTTQNFMSISQSSADLE